MKSEPELNGKSILEVGYGAGYLFPLYKELGLEAFGYDFSELAYNYVMKKRLVRRSHLFKDSSEITMGYFDYVSAFEVMEHIEEDVDALCLWRGYLKNCGKLLLSVPAHRSRWDSNDEWAGHFRRYEKSELFHKLKTAGLCLDEIYTYDFPACIILDVLRNRNRSKVIKNDHYANEDKMAATKRSGIVRDFSPLIRVLSNPILQAPLIKMEEPFYRTDWGSGYILIAHVV